MMMAMMMVHAGGTLIVLRTGETGDVLRFPRQTARR